VVDQPALQALHLRQSCEIALHIIETAGGVLDLYNAGMSDPDVTFYVFRRDVEFQMMVLRHIDECAQLAAPADDGGVVLRYSHRTADVGLLNAGPIRRVVVRRG
jgi:hypothetical protein